MRTLFLNLCKSCWLIDGGLLGMVVPPNKEVEGGLPPYILCSCVEFVYRLIPGVCLIDFSS